MGCSGRGRVASGDSRPRGASGLVPQHLTRPAPLTASLSQFPRACDEGYETVWREGAATCRVVAPKFRESHTQYDPELMERKHLPREERRELFRPRTKPAGDSD